MTNKEWEEFKRQAESDEPPPEVKTRDILELLQEIDQLKRGEFICLKYGLRKDGEHDREVDF